MAKGKLLKALGAHQGQDYKLEKQRKQQKQATKKKKSKPPLTNLEGKDKVQAHINGTNSFPQAESEGWESDESEAAETTAVYTSRLLDSDSDSDSSLGAHAAAESNPEELEDEDEEIPLSDIESLATEEKADVLPHQRLTINNTSALQKAHKSIALSYSTLGFSAHQTVTTSEPVTIADVNDDLTRELAFYKQCLDGANQGRTLLNKEAVPFSRPNDYFAEMVKSDEHMGKIKAKMTDEAANKKAAADARKQRDLKRFGKQVQVAKLQERDKARRETLDKVKLLKRKRANADTGAANEEDLFDVALDEAAKEDRSSRSTRDGPGRRGPPNKRQKKNEKFGFGGRKRFSKSTNADSTADMRGFSSRKMKGKKGQQRLGKNRRAMQ